MSSTKEHPKEGGGWGFSMRFLQDLKKPSVPTRVLHRVPNSRIQLIILFTVIFVACTRLQWFQHPTNSMISDMRMYVCFLFFVLTYLGYFFLPEPSKSKPGKWFWKLVQGLTLAYSIMVFGLLFFSPENLQVLLRDIFDSRLGVPLAEKDYAADCRVFTPEHPTSWMGNITDHIDIFVLAHFLGWAFKIWIFRNHTLAWIMSVGFEFLEFNMEVWLPNFKECWWDKWILDVFGCNLIGMIIGLWTMKVFKMRKHYWFMEPSQKGENLSLWGKFKYMLTSREDFIKQDKWHWLAEPWTFNGVIFFTITNYALDMSYFYFKSQIHLPPSHWLFAIRIWTLAFFSIIASNDYYDYLVERKLNSMTVPLFMMYFVIGCEWLLFYKNMKPGLFDPPVYAEVRYFWYLVLTLWLSVNAYLIYARYFKKGSVMRLGSSNRKKSEVSNPDSTQQSSTHQKAY